jgi:CubicO group peptidase (beta-lactamase class C family)
MRIVKLVPTVLTLLTFCLAAPVIAEVPRDLQQLYEQGKLQLNDPESKYTPLPIFRNKNSCCSEPTLLNIFTHTSGGGEVKSFRDAPKFFREFFNGTNLQPRKTYAQLFQRGIHTRICPGTKWAYCNYCVGSLGMVLEQITGQAFQQYTDAHIFSPLGMNSSSFYETEQTQANLAVGYAWKAKKKTLRYVPRKPQG